MTANLGVLFLVVKVELIHKFANEVALSDFGEFRFTSTQFCLN